MPRTVTERVRRWVARQLQTDDLTIGPYDAGLTGTVFRVRTGSGYACVLRTLSPTAWGSEAARHVGSEQLGCTLLRDTAIPVPELIAVDADGSVAGAPSSLTTELPGRMELGPPSPAAVVALAEAAAAIHATPVTGRRPHAYQLWTQGTVKVPDFARDRGLWARAIEIFRTGPPPTPAVLIHRDFHPGNVLWRGETISGVIDWAETAWGPADLDVAHCATNLALLAGAEHAAAFRAAYLDAGGRLATGAAGAYWALADLLGFLPDPFAHLSGLLKVRTDLDASTVRDRLEALAAATVDDL